jgi:hypothetical protein
MFEEMDESAFPEFLAAFWAEKNWDTSVTANDDGTYLVAGDKDSGKRGLIGVRPGEDTEVDASEVEDFAAFCERKGVDVRVMATRGRFTTGAHSAAEAADVHLLDPNELATSVRDEGAEHLLDDFEGESGGGRFPSIPIPVPAGIPVVPLLVAAMVVAAAVFVGPTLLGSVPFVGGGGGDGGGSSGPNVTALSLSDANETAVDVRWNVRTQTDLGNYSAPTTNQTFVVVQFEASSTSNGTVALRDGDFALAVGGSFQPVQGFENASDSFQATQLPKPVTGNETVRGVIVFLAPADFDGATLVETYEGPGVRFERDGDLEFDVE